MGHLCWCSEIGRHWICGRKLPRAENNKRTQRIRVLWGKDIQGVEGGDWEDEPDLLDRRNTENVEKWEIRSIVADGEVSHIPVESWLRASGNYELLCEESKSNLVNRDFIN